MSDEFPTIQPEDVAPPEPPTFVQRFEDDVKEVVQAIEAIPAKVESKASAVEAAIDGFWLDFIRNASPQIPTAVHNYVMEAKEALKAKITALL